MYTKFIVLFLLTFSIVQNNAQQRRFEDMDDDSDIPLFNEDSANWPIDMDMSEFAPCEAIDGAPALVCQNGGTCLRRINTGAPQCLCALGYMGENCEQENHIQLQQKERMRLEDREYTLCPRSNRISCFFGGTCVLKNDEPFCICKRGYKGPNCRSSEVSESEELDSDISSSGTCPEDQNPCREGSTCVQTSTGATCVCAPGWTGINCDEPITEAPTTGKNPTNSCGDFNPCREGSTCVLEKGSPKCYCATGWSGMNCDQRLPMEGEVSSTRDSEDEDDDEDDEEMDYRTQVPLMFSPCKLQDKQSFCAPYGGECWIMGMRGSSHKPSPMCFCHKGYHGDKCQYFSWKKLAGVPEPTENDLMTTAQPTRQVASESYLQKMRNLAADVVLRVGKMWGKNKSKN